MLSESKPNRVLWSSIWLDHPELTIEFAIEPDGVGSIVTWTLIGPAELLDADDIARRRYRLNQLINGHFAQDIDQ